MADYMRWLRGQVGRRKILLVFASACVRDDAGRVLWQRRSDFGWWGLPGGVLELDESLAGCAVREVREETGLEVEPIHLVGLYTSPDFDVTYPNGDQVQQMTACFECRVAGGSIRPDGGETLELNWFSPQEAPPTALWYRAMAADLAGGELAASFLRGSAGLRKDGLPYYRWLRRFIGEAPFVMPAAAALVRDGDGQVLLIRRGDTGDWSIPGGGMELGERIDRTVVDEVREETGLKVWPGRLIGLYSSGRYWIAYPNGDQVKVASALFQCEIIGGELRPDGVEALEARFFPVDQLPPLAERYLYRVQGLSLIHI